MILLNLTSTPIGIHKLSPFEIVTGCPMHLTLASFAPELIKREMFQYCKGLMASIKNNHVLVEQPFHSMLLWYKDLKYHTSHLATWKFVYWNRHLQKNSLQSQWKGPYQVLLTNPCATQLQGIGFWIHVTHLEKVPNPNWTGRSSGDLKVKISQKWGRQHLMR